MLTLRNVNMKYGSGNSQVHALKNITLDIESNEIIILMGKSGSGKSTLLKIIAGNLQPTDGDILIDGISLSKLKTSNRVKLCSEKIGFVWQDFQLIDDMTARDNILLPAFIHKKDYDVAYYEDLVDTLGISNRLKHYPDQLSGGEKQRVALARSLLLKPGVVLADEPTGALDSTNSQVIMDIITKAHKLFSQTFIIATHDESFLSIGHRTLHLRDGALVK